MWVSQHDVTSAGKCKLLHARTFNLGVVGRVLLFSSSTYYKHVTLTLDSTCSSLRTIPTALKPELHDVEAELISQYGSQVQKRDSASTRSVHSLNLSCAVVGKAFAGAVVSTCIYAHADGSHL